MKNSALASVIFLTIVCSPAHAVELGFLGGLNLNLPKAESAGLPQTAGSRLGSLAGVSFALELAPNIRLETGAFYSRRNFSFPVLGLATDVSTSNLQIPLLFRIKFASFFSIASGAFFSQGIGGIESISSPDGVNRFIVNSNYSDLGLNATDFGIIETITFSIPMNNFSAILFDFRFLLGFSNLDRDSGEALGVKEIQFLFGSRFTF